MKYWFLLFAVLFTELSLVASDQAIDFKLHTDYLILTRCSIANSHDLVALIDTGATETAIDANLAKRLRLKTTSDSATLGTRNVRVSAVSIPDLALGPLRAQNLSAISVEGSHVERQLGFRVDVIVGMDVLGRTNFLIDYKAKTITFGIAPRFAHQAPLLRSHHFALVPVLVEKARLVLQLDTGLNGVIIYAGKIPVSHYSLNASSVTPVAGRPVQTASVSLKIGDWEQRQATIAVTDDSPEAGTPFDGLLGIRALGVHRVSFDWEKSTMSWD